MPSITYLLSQYPTINHTYLLREVTGLRALGWDVDVISIQRPGPDQVAAGSAEADEARRTRYVNRPAGAFAAAALGAIARRPLGFARAAALALRLAPSWSAVPRWLVYAAQATVVAGMAREGDPVHAHFCLHMAVLLDAVRGGHAPWSMSVHGPAEFDGPKAYLLPEVLRRATWVRTISALGRALCLLRAEGGRVPPVVVNRLGLPLPNGVRLGVRRPVTGAFRFVTVGRLSVEKGQDVLLRALRLAIDDGAELTLRFVGGGPAEPTLRALATALRLDARVEFAGWVEPAHITDELAEADGFVSASFAEGIPLVLMEAMVAGLPCIATSVGGVAELVVHGETGLMVPPADEHRLAAAMRTLAGDPALATRLREGGAARVAAEYDLTRNVAALAALHAAHLPRTDGGGLARHPAARASAAADPIQPVLT